MKIFIYPILMIALAVPLMANQSCSSALKEAEQDASAAQADVIEDPLPAHGDKQLPVLPEGGAGKQLLDGSGPEVISPHVDGE